MEVAYPIIPEGDNPGRSMAAVKTQNGSLTLFYRRTTEVPQMGLHRVNYIHWEERFLGNRPALKVDVFGNNLVIRKRNPETADRCMRK